MFSLAQLSHRTIGKSQAFVCLFQTPRKEKAIRIEFVVSKFFLRQATQVTPHCLLHWCQKYDVCAN